MCIAPRQKFHSADNISWFGLKYFLLVIPHPPLTKKKKKEEYCVVNDVNQNRKPTFT